MNFIKISLVRNTSGMMLTQLMVSAGVMSVLMLGFSQMVVAQQRSVWQLQAKITRNLLQMRLQQAMLSPMAMKASLDLPANLSFKRCTPTAGATCQATSDWVGFRLLDGPSSPIAGQSDSSPMRYAIDGVPCSAPSATCSIRVMAQYRAFCPLGASTCPSAQSASQIRYVINQDPAALSTGGAVMAAMVSAPMVMGSQAASSGIVLANNVPYTTSTTIPPYTCANAIRVEMQMDGIRDQGFNGSYSGKIYDLRVNGVASSQSRLEFGSTKTGGSGHGWGYTARGLQKTRLITNVEVQNTLVGQIQGVGAYAGNAVTIENATYSVTCL